MLVDGLFRTAPIAELRTSWSPPLCSHFLSSARCRTFFKNSVLLLSCVFSRLRRSGFGLTWRDAYLNLEHGPRIGDDSVSRRGRVFGSRGESGGELCDGRRGDEESGEGTAGRCGEEKSRLNMGAGIVANMSSLVLSFNGGTRRIDYVLVAGSGELVEWVACFFGFKGCCRGCKNSKLEFPLYAGDGRNPRLDAIAHRKCTKAGSWTRKEISPSSASALTIR